MFSAYHLIFFTLNIKTDLLLKELILNSESASNYEERQRTTHSLEIATVNITVSAEHKFISFPFGNEKEIADRARFFWGGSDVTRNEAKLRC